MSQSTTGHSPPRGTSTNGAPRAAQTYPFRVRNFPYRAQSAVTVEPLPGSTGFLLFLNVGTNKEGEQDLVRAFSVYTEHLPKGVTFVPANDGMLILDVDEGTEFPSNAELSKIGLHKLQSRVYASASPQTIRQRPPG